MIKNQFGRSMVEMIGVLAIVGILSVGAIAGYSSAMEKHKLNKYTTDINMMIMNLRILQAEQKTLTAIKNDYFVPKSLHSDYNRYKNSTTFPDKYGNMWGNNTYGFYVRIGGSVSSKERETAIKRTCPIIIQAGVDMQMKKMSLSHQKGGASICAEKNCTYKPNQLTLEKINEFCDIILNAQNADAILYFYS